MKSIGLAVGVPRCGPKPDAGPDVTTLEDTATAVEDTSVADTFVGDTGANTVDASALATPVADDGSCRCTTVGARASAPWWLALLALSMRGRRRSLTLTA